MKNIEEVFYKHGFPLNRLIAGSKSGYRKNHPDDVVLFNANIIVRRKAWYGDLNITQDAYDLQKVCNEIGKKLYILPEMYARFGEEDRPFKKLKKDSRAVFIPGENHYLLMTYGDGIRVKKLKTFSIVGAAREEFKKVYF